MTEVLEERFSGQGAREERARLRELLDACMLRDRDRLARRIARLGRRRAGDGAAIEALAAEARASAARRAARAAARPPIAFDARLPIAAHRERIARAIAEHPVVVVCGETGSGKTTQLAKICLSLGRGVAGMIGHTQPRRVAARAVARRLAGELGAAPGTLVAHKVRFDDRVGPQAMIKVMTDGIALAEVAQDPSLLAYDTLIIDEAHERSVNIDLLFGVLRRLVRVRPELRVVVTSADIDTARVAAFFDGAPVIEVGGRRYPVEIRWRAPGPEAAPGTPGFAAALVAAVGEVLAEGPGDVLVFLPGERDIREAAALLRRDLGAALEVLPLYARLGPAAQDRVFAVHARRRVVLATNIAETSLTVPGIRFVVDSGLARIARFNPRARIQGLQIEPISRASAGQRAGRCGREGPGVCVRLYGEEDHARRPLYAEPAIRTSDLSALVLQMLALGLGDPGAFAFIDPPPMRRLRDAVRLLGELGAVDARGRITGLGRRMARLPVAPRIGRMILAAARGDCLREVLVIASALAVGEVREPERGRARRVERALHDAHSDFLGWLKLWRAYWRRGAEHGRADMQRWCARRRVSYTRMGEWIALHDQLRRVTKDLGLTVNAAAAGSASIHRALLAGLLDRVGALGEEGAYRDPRGQSFHLHPASALARRRPAWVMVAEFIETGRVYGCVAARIRPQWIEQVAGPAVRREWVDTAYEPAAGEVIGWRRIEYRALTLALRRRGWFGRERPEAAHEVFLRQALVEGGLRGRPPFLEHNLALVERVARLRDRLRGPAYAGDEALYAFYRERVPPSVHDAASLRAWLASPADVSAGLFLEERDVLVAGARERLAAFPDQVAVAGGVSPVHYRFAPGEHDDGVSIGIALAVLGEYAPWQFDWLVPGFLAAKVEALLRALPKHWRRPLVPVGRWVRAFLAHGARADAPLTASLAGFLRERVSLPGAGEELAGVLAATERVLPEHLHIRFELYGPGGEAIAQGRDFEALRSGHARAAARAFATSLPAGIERGDLSGWDFGPLPAEREIACGPVTVRAHAGLCETGRSVALRWYPSAAQAHDRTRAGVLRLALNALGRDLRGLWRRRPLPEALVLRYALVPGDGVPGAPLEEAIARHVVVGALGPLPGDAAQFDALVDMLRADLGTRIERALPAIEAVLGAHAAALGALREARTRVDEAALADARAHLRRLVHAGFLEALPAARLEALARYLRAIGVRLERLPGAPQRDRRLTGEVRRLEARREAYLAHWRPCAHRRALLERFGWLLEEWRVSLFAQEIGTAEPVSEQRLERLWSALDACGCHQTVISFGSNSGTST